MFSCVIVLSYFLCKSR